MNLLYCASNCFTPLGCILWPATALAVLSTVYMLLNRSFPFFSLCLPFFSSLAFLIRAFPFPSYFSPAFPLSFSLLLSFLPFHGLCCISLYSSKYVPIFPYPSFPSLSCPSLLFPSYILLASPFLFSFIQCISLSNSKYVPFLPYFPFFSHPTCTVCLSPLLLPSLLFSSLHPIIYRVIQTIDTMYVSFLFFVCQHIFSGHVNGMLGLVNKTKGLQFCKDSSGFLELYDDPEVRECW